MLSSKYREILNGACGFGRELSYITLNYMYRISAHTRK